MTRGTTSVAGLGEFYGGNAKWTDGRAWVTVPIDYRNPDHGTLDLALVRYPAGEPERRLGTLLVCPDDPGSPGTELAAQLARLLPRDVLDRFDLVGFDHRFSGASAPLAAGLTEDEIYWAFHQPESFDAEVRFQRDLVEKCFDTVSASLPYITTRDIARDIDIIRAALGEERISLLGHNYGGHIATVYTELFGERTDRVVVDSVIDPDWVWRGLFLTVAAGVQHGLGRWARWCAEHGRIGADERAVLTYVDRLVEQAAGGGTHIGPVPATEAMVRMLTAVMLSTDRTYPALAGLLAVAAGDAEPDGDLLAEFGALFGSPKAESSAIAHLAILSGEWAWPRDLEVYRTGMTEAARRTPLIGAAMAGPKAGAFWPVAPREPVTAIGAGNRAESILLLQSDNDPFTPPSGARNVRKLLPRNSRLVLAENLAHHRVFPFSGHEGIARITTDYLVGGRLPDADRTTADPEATP